MSYRQKIDVAKGLEIGCGNNPQPGYLHCDRYLDRNNIPFVDVCCDARRLPFRDGEFDSVLMFGVFEHLGLHEAQEALLEVSRCLKGGGIFKFDVPDFDWFVARYLDRKVAPHRDDEWFMKSFYGSQEREGMFHRWAWNQGRIEAFLAKPNWEFSSFKLVGRRWRDPEKNHLIYECVK